MDNSKIIKSAEDAVCTQLKSPASAIFSQEIVSGSESIGFTVTGFVDSQNSYGAMIRNDFKVELSCLSNGEFLVKNVSVGAKANAERSKAFGQNYIANLILTAIGGAILYFIITIHNLRQPNNAQKTAQFFIQNTT